MKNVTLVIPALNEEETVEALLKDLFKVSQRIIVVDDGSTDRTGVIARKAGAEVLRHDLCKGYDVSVSDGLNHAFQTGSEIVVTCDADGQHRADDVARVVQSVSGGGVDFSVGVRDQYNRLAERIIGFASLPIYGSKDIFCGLKGYSQGFYKACGPFPQNMNIGTLPFAQAKKYRMKMALIHIQVNPRSDDSRFSKSVMGNFLEVAAFLKTLVARV